ncbi:MAG: STAS domain-containing protein [Deltaproteobacteria bacterium]|nr:STAS domain-containing protein [Deltaproteobacteria bacterium]
MKFTIDETGKRGLIKTESAVTVRNIAQAKDFFMEALRQVDVLELDMDIIPEVDLCALQLGCSLQRTAVKLNKKVIYPKTTPPAFTKAVEESGVCFYAGCESAGESCFFWKRGHV